MTLSTIQPAVPRPKVATYGPPWSLRRWLTTTSAAVAHHAEASAVVERVRRLIPRFQAMWVPARNLPIQLIRGNATTSNIVADSRGAPIHLDAPGVHAPAAE